MININPCPFCHGKAYVECDSHCYGAVQEDLFYYVACNNCDATGPDEDDKESAISRWNEAWGSVPSGKGA
jgi:Lar family restriction alleviation protein